MGFRGLMDFRGVCNKKKKLEYKKKVEWVFRPLHSQCTWNIESIDW